jgi:hypothetical protein
VGSQDDLRWEVAVFEKGAVFKGCCILDDDPHPLNEREHVNGGQA